MESLKQITNEPIKDGFISTQFIWLGGCRQLVGVDMRLLAEAFPHVVFSPKVRDLGMTLD